MGDTFPTHTVAAIQAAPVFLDRDASVTKACRLIAEAGANGAKLAVFGETWLPGYPIWLDVAPGAGLWDYQPAKDVFTRLVANAVEVPGPATDALGAAAANAGCAVVMGINERERGRASGTLYNSIIYLGPDGQLLGKHRKLTPTYTERLVWGSGDGSTLSVFDTPLGQVGGLVCWEHWMPLARHAMHVTGEQVHAALWPTVHDTHLVASRHYAFEGRCFVIAVGSVLRRDQVPDDLSIFDEVTPDGPLLAGGSAIIGPDGKVLAGPLGAEEAILYADLDFARIPAEQLTFDAVGHYGRPDIFTLTVNTRPQNHLDLEGESIHSGEDASTGLDTEA